MMASPTYISFLVRLWREPSQETPTLPADWRSEVECIQTGQHWTFDTLDELLDCLRRQVQDMTVPGRLGESQ